MTVRVSVVSGSRRIDLAVPDTVPLAELVPVFASHLVDDDVAELAVQTLAGMTLATDLGLRAQHVRDGDILSLAARADDPPPFAHDDLATAVRSALTPPVESLSRQGLLIGFGIVVVLTLASRLVESVVWLSAFGAAVVVVLALPHATASWVVARSVEPLDVEQLGPVATRARHLLCEGRAAALTVLSASTAVVGTTVWR